MGIVTLILLGNQALDKTSYQKKKKKKALD